MKISRKVIFYSIVNQKSKEFFCNNYLRKEMLVLKSRQPLFLILEELQTSEYKVGLPVV